MWSTYVILAVSVVCANAFSTGAPDGACEDMVPQHHVPPQKSAAPYTVTTSSKVVKAGSPLEVVISGNGAENTIRGILLQARQGKKIVGKFTLAPNDSFAQLLNCGEPGNAVTHKQHSESEDKRSVAFKWTAPADFNDEITFRATVALNGVVFWVGIESAPVKVSS